MGRDPKAGEPRSIGAALRSIVNEYGDGGLQYLHHQHWEQAEGLTVAEPV